MSYTVLARRYRSTTFDEVVGQNHVAQTIKKAIESGRIAHAYLFCGTRGVGKTSMARILAKALNCDKAKGPTGEPCNQCQSCQAIARGEDMDVIEIDAASNTGVDNIREVIENSQYRPARSRFKVYIIDEVHMLSKSAFNALLKTLEEPPSHVKFILATTEPEKVLPTILSRCQRYDFRNISTREIAEHLKEICKKETINAEDDALLMVAKVGAGSMRDALSLLDRLLSIGEKHLNTEMIEQLLGLPKTQMIFELVQGIGTGDTKTVLTLADSMIQSGLSPDTLIASLVDHLRNLLVLRACGIDSKLVEVPGLSLNDLQKQADQFDPITLTQDITILEELRRQMRQSQAGRALLDATLMRLALADQFASIGQLLARINGTPTASAPPTQKKKSEPLIPIPPRPSAAPSASPIKSAESSNNSGTVVDVEVDDDLPRPGKVWEGNQGPSLSELMKQHAKAPANDSQPSPSPNPDSNVTSVNPEDLPSVWTRLLTLVAEHGPGLPAILAPARLARIEEEWAVIQYAAPQETLMKMLDRNGRKDHVRTALSKTLSRPIGVRYELDDTLSPPPSNAPSAITPPEPAHRSSIPQPRQAEAPAPAPPAAPSIPLTRELRESLESDPLIRRILDTLNGNIVKVE